MRYSNRWTNHLETGIHVNVGRRRNSKGWKRLWRPNLRRRVKRLYSSDVIGRL